MKTAVLCLCAQAPLANMDEETWFSPVPVTSTESFLVTELRNGPICNNIYRYLDHRVNKSAAVFYTLLRPYN